MASSDCGSLRLVWTKPQTTCHASGVAHAPGARVHAQAAEVDRPIDTALEQAGMPRAV
jgi:hypothetical protein